MHAHTDILGIVAEPLSEQRGAADMMRVVRHLDAEGNPMYAGEYAAVTRLYDDQKRVIREAYYDKEGQPATQSKGYSMIFKEYGDTNKPVRTIYADAEGNPVMTTDGYAILVTLYDDRGNAIEERRYDTEGNQVPYKDAVYASMRKEYNSINKATRTDYLDLEGNPVTLKDGYCSIRNEYDDKGNLIYEAYYNRDGWPVFVESRGYASRLDLYRLIREWAALQRAKLA